MDNIIEKVAIAIYKSERNVVPWGYGGNGSAERRCRGAAEELVQMLKGEGLVVVEKEAKVENKKGR